MYDLACLPEESYYQDVIPKDAIFIHHTAGYFRPDWVINSWNRERRNSTNKIRSCSSFVIGSIDPIGTESKKWDGKILQAFDPKYWAHHLFIKSKSNTFINQKSISIELCNYGELNLSKNGKFYTFTHLEIPENQVIEISEGFRGYRYFHSYTEPQIESLRKVILLLADHFEIDIKRGLKSRLSKQNLQIPENLSIIELQRWLNKNGVTDNVGKRIKETGTKDEKMLQALDKIGESAFEFDIEASRGCPGLWSHTSVRKDKIDIFPQLEMVQMIISL